MKIVRQYDLAGKSAGLGRTSAKLQQTAFCVGCMLLLRALNWSVECYQTGKQSIEAMAAHMCLMLFDGIGPMEQSRSAEVELLD